MRISDFIINKDKYKVDSTYQRPADAWSRKDKQCLIDTIIRGEPVPLFFLNYITEEDAYYIVDGQQRMQCIKEFCDNKFPLSKEFSISELDGKKFEDLSTQERKQIQDYNLNVKIMKDYDDERIRMIFSRLQRGKALRLGEILNAKPGKVVDVMRKISNHDFITKSIGVNKQRYQTYEDVARIMYYEKYGSKECSTNYLYELFEKYRDDINLSSKYYKKINNVLNYLLKCFPAVPGNYQFLKTHAWVQTVYSVISDLRDTYALNGREKEIAAFVENFHSRVYSEDWRISDIKIQRFYDNARGGWSERLNENRKNTMKEFLIKELKLRQLDENRQISEEDKIAIYGKVNGCCEKCSKKFKDYKEPEYHHIELYSEGGETTIDNIMVLCQDCHDDIHRTTADVAIIPEEDYEIEEA